MLDFVRGAGGHAKGESSVIAILQCTVPQSPFPRYCAKDSWSKAQSAMLETMSRRGNQACGKWIAIRRSTELAEKRLPFFGRLAPAEAATTNPPVRLHRFSCHPQTACHFLDELPRHASRPSATGHRPLHGLGMQFLSPDWQPNLRSVTIDHCQKCRLVAVMEPKPQPKPIRQRHLFLDRLRSD